MYFYKEKYVLFVCILVLYVISIVGFCFAFPVLEGVVLESGYNNNETKYIYNNIIDENLESFYPETFKECNKTINLGLVKYSYSAVSTMNGSWNNNSYHICTNNYTSTKYFSFIDYRNCSSCSAAEDPSSYESCAEYPIESSSIGVSAGSYVNFNEDQNEACGINTVCHKCSMSVGHFFGTVSKNKYFVFKLINKKKGKLIINGIVNIRNPNAIPSIDNFTINGLPAKSSIITYYKQKSYYHEMNADVVWEIPFAKQTDLVSLTPAISEGYGEVVFQSVKAEYEQQCDLAITSLNGPGTNLAFGAGGSYQITGSYTTSSSDSVKWTLTLPDGSVSSGTKNEISATWNGNAANGTLATIGAYNATLTVTSSADNTCTATQTLPIIVSPATDDSCGLLVSFGSTAHVANGNISHSQNLFASKGSVLAADFTLYYNSLDPVNGFLGRGWSHSYSASLKENSDGSVLISEGNWKYRYFTLNGSSYTPQSGDYSTLVKNVDGTFTLTEKDGTVSTFAANGTISSITDRNGNSQAFSYSNGNLSGVTDPSGRSATFAYDAANHLTSVTDPSGNTYSFVVGTTLNSVTQPDGGIWNYTYDDKAFMLSKTDPLHNVTTYGYDGNHRVVSSTDPEGKTRSIAYPQSTDTVKRTTFTEKDGGIWSYSYDTQKGYLLSKTDPQGGTTSYTYDQSGNRTSTIAPDGTTVSYVYDGQGNMTSTTDALGQIAAYTYNGFGQVTSVTDPLGGKTAYTYDAKGNLTGLTDQTGATTTYEYDGKGNTTKIIDALGNATSFTYDKSGNLATTTDSNGATTSYTYDQAGNIITITDAKGATTKFVYDNGNRLVKSIDPQGNATFYTYDSNGNKLTATDANGNTTHYAYNWQNQLVKAIDALGNVTVYAYGGMGCTTCGGGGNGKLTSLTDANGNATSFSYDQLGRLTGELDPLGNVTSYIYDAKGNLTARTDANGSTITYSYDATGKLLKKSYPDNTEESFTYDAKGNMLTATNKNISYTFGYDSAGRMLSSTDSNNKTVNYSYDLSGNRTKLTYPDGFSANYVYDTTGRLSRLTTSNSQEYAFTYDNLGRRTKLSYPNGASATYGYDTTGRLLSLVHKGALGVTIDRFTYTLDKIGNRLSKKEPLFTTMYTYDAIYRLTLAKPGLPWETTEQYGYDNVGNRLSGPTTAKAYQYNQANQLTAETIPPPGILQDLFGASAVPTGKARYEYDKNGNLIKKTETTRLPDKPVTTQYSYDFENRLTQTEIHFGPATFTTTFSYDPLGRRIGKKTTGINCLINGSDTHAYVYDNQNIILESRDTNILGADFIGISRYLHGPGTDEPLSLTRNNNTWYYHADGLGSIVALSNKYGIVVEKYGYDSFGNQKPAIHLISQPYAYTAREWDEETGLYYYRARYYDPRVGRFIQKDPIIHPVTNMVKSRNCSPAIYYPSFDDLMKNPEKLNPYNYTENNPIRYKDPSGLIPDDNSYCANELKKDYIICDIKFADCIKCNYLKYPKCAKDTIICKWKAYLKSLRCVADQNNL